MLECLLSCAGRCRVPSVQRRYLLAYDERALVRCLLGLRRWAAGRQRINRVGRSLQ